MTKLMIFAAASLLALGAAPASRAEEKLTLLGGCPDVLQKPDCPAAHREGSSIPSDFPPDAHPGQCFAQVRTRPTYETYSERYEVSPGRRERRVIPAVYEWSERQVLVEPARTERRVIPATFRAVTETVVVSPATVRTERSEPVFETVTERVIARPAHAEWRRTFVGPGGFLPEGARVQPTGEVVCLVEVPAEYATVERRVMRDPGRTVEIPVPAVTRPVTRQVIDQPERIEDLTIPAVYRTERFRRLVSAERVDYIDVPPVYGMREARREISPGVFEWRQVSCDPNTLAPVHPH